MSKYHNGGDSLAPSGSIATASRVGFLRRLHEEETGSQAMEYGALACGGVGVTGIIISILNSDTVQDKLTEIFTGALDGLSTALGGLF